MSWDHDRVEELLAGRALEALDPDEAAVAERAVVEHVPDCERCRASLDAFRAVAGDLGLATPVVTPPPELRARLRRTVAGEEPRSRLAWLAGAAAALVLLFGGLSGWSLALSTRLADAETRQAWLVDAVSTLGDPDAEVLELEGSSPARINVFYLRGQRRMYLVASNMDRPGEGVYKVWVVHEGDPRTGGTFVPDDGVVMVPVESHPGGVEAVMVTHERVEDAPTPTASPIASATVAPAG